MVPTIGWIVLVFDSRGSVPRCRPAIVTRVEAGSLYLTIFSHDSAPSQAVVSIDEGDSDDSGLYWTWPPRT